MLYGAMSRTVPIADQLARNAQRQQDAFAAMAKALAAGDTAGRERAQAKIAELTAEYQRLTEALRFNELEAREIATPRARKPGKPLRELALDALDDLGVPAAPALIADLTAALTGARPSPSRFASLRRDEENAARRNIAARPAWVVPAINAQQLTAIPRLLSSSSWELERRIVGAAQHPHEQPADRHQPVRPPGAPARSRRARSQAGRAPALSLRPLGARRRRITASRSITARTIEAARVELALIEAPDLEERREAAAKLATARPQVRLWGRPVLIDTAEAERAVR